MDYYAGNDVSLERSSICVVDGNGKILREGKAASEPAALIGWLESSGLGSHGSVWRQARSRNGCTRP